jgi:hypothetical protein
MSVHLSHSTCAAIGAGGYDQNIGPELARVAHSTLTGSVAQHLYRQQTYMMAATQSLLAANIDQPETQ